MFLIYVDFSILCNVISQFPENGTNFLKNRITFPPSKSKISIEWRNNVIEGSNYYVDLINTKICNYYKISDLCFHDVIIYKRSRDMRVTCENMFQRQHLPKNIDSFI